MEKSVQGLRFDSATTFTGLDFIARSVAVMSHNGTPLSPDAICGNTTPEQKAIFLSRLAFHQDRLKTQPGR